MRTILNWVTIICTLIITVTAMPTLAAEGSTDKALGLHSDGGVWKLYPAENQVEELPNILLIGDSIMNGYRKQVAAGLKGRANVHCWLTPVHLNSKDLHRDLEKVVSHMDYSVIHFNIGLHSHRYSGMAR